MRLAVLLGGIVVFTLPGVVSDLDADEQTGPFFGRPYGIEQRVAWTTSRVVGSPDPPLPYRVARTFEKLKWDRPLYIANEPGTDRLLVVQQNGKILRFRNNPEVEQAELFLDTGREAYGLTFHPEYASNGFLYVVTNGPPSARVKSNRISRFTVSREPPHRCDPESERIIIEWKSNGHNGGDLAFGPDGYLYITAGDGTSDSDTELTGQDVSNLNGTLIRIDVDQPEPGQAYAIPPDNPFVDREGFRPENWAYGFRNPWRMTFDQETGHLWVGNIGQDQWEMIHLVQRGDNYGWSVTEGSYPFYLERQRGPTPIVKPTIEHPHSEARSITGGVVYYGRRYPELRGAYLYGDYSTGKIWAVRHDGTQIVWHREIADSVLQILGFGVDEAGELLIVDYAGGIYRLEPMPETVPESEFPVLLSETGLFESVKHHQPHPALIPYSVNAPLWSDGADKQRFIALPGLSQIEFTRHRGWNFPDGTVLVKTFSLDGVENGSVSPRRIETRLLTRQQGEWVGYSYLWNEEQTDARLVESAGLDREYLVHDPQSATGTRRQTWHYPSRAECMVCHTRAANFVLGLSELQMNKVHDYGGVKDNQLRTLAHIGVFRVRWSDFEKQWQRRIEATVQTVHRGLLRSLDLDRRVRPGMESPLRRISQGVDVLLPASWKQIVRGSRTLGTFVLAQVRQRVEFVNWLPRFPHEYRRLVDPYDPRYDLESRARSYLHANCAICHVPAGGGNAAMELEFATPREKTNLFGGRPLHDKFGIEDARLVAPGDPNRSVLLKRMSRRGRGQMPPLASSRVDQRAVELLRAWIAEMETDSRD